MRSLLILSLCFISGAMIGATRAQVPSQTIQLTGPPSSPPVDTYTDNMYSYSVTQKSDADVGALVVTPCSTCMNIALTTPPASATTSCGPGCVAWIDSEGNKFQRTQPLGENIGTMAITKLPAPISIGGEALPPKGTVTTILNGVSYTIGFTGTPDHHGNWPLTRNGQPSNGWYGQMLLLDGGEIYTPANWGPSGSWWYKLDLANPPNSTASNPP